MEEKLSGNEFEDIFFSEKDLENVEILKEISVNINRQNSNLNEVKKLMVSQAKSVGADTIINFQYGQRSNKWYEHFLVKWDQETWFGTGKAIKYNS